SSLPAIAPSLPKDVNMTGASSNYSRHSTGTVFPAFFIYRLLPLIAQQVTIQLIWKRSFPQTDYVEMTKQTEDQLKLLEELGIVHRQSDGKLAIDHDYKRFLTNAAMLGAANILSLVLETNKEKRPRKEIEQKAAETWDYILR
ncbi:unnamed protein product, partial [Caenorhabditis brenneri]